MKKRKDFIIFLIIYLVALAITLNFALRNPISSDRGLEYDVYHFTVETGQWVQPGPKDPLNAKIGYLVNSSVTVTYIPAYVQRITHLNELLVFKTWPCFFYALMPAFVYLLSRRYLNVKLSILTAMMILTNFYFMYYSNIGRVGVALGFSAVLMWALLGTHYLTSAIATVLIVLSHYATAFIVLSLLIFALIYLAILHRKTSKVTISALSVMLVAVGVWYFGIASSVGEITKLFVADTLAMSAKQTTPTPSVSNPLPNIGNTPASLPIPPDTQSIANPKSDFFSLTSREELIQVAFGKTWHIMNIPQKIEFVLSWFLVLSVAWGLLFVFWKRTLPPLLVGLGIGSFGLLLITFLLPHLSVYYGMERVWFTGLITLAACWVIGTKRLGIYTQCSILIVYGLATSGILHRIFGLLK